MLMAHFSVEATCEASHSLREKPCLVEEFMVPERKQGITRKKRHECCKRGRKTQRNERGDGHRSI